MSTVVCFVIHGIILPRYCRPKSLPKDKYASFDNIAVSFCHSTVTGLGSWLSLTLNPSLRDDLLYIEFIRLHNFGLLNFVITTLDYTLDYVVSFIYSTSSVAQIQIITHAVGNTYRGNTITY